MLCSFHCTVVSLVNDTWGDWHEEEYVFKANLLYLTSMKLPTLALKDKKMIFVCEGVPLDLLQFRQKSNNEIKSYNSCKRASIGFRFSSTIDFLGHFHNDNGTHIPCAKWWHYLKQFNIRFIIDKKMNRQNIQYIHIKPQFKHSYTWPCASITQVFRFKITLLTFSSSSSSPSTWSSSKKADR